MQVLIYDYSRILYRITENRFRSTLNQFFAQGDAARHYSLFMVQLLRLRQCTSHPFMLEQTIRESWTLGDLDELKHRLARLDNGNLAPFYKQVECWVEERNETGGEEQEVLPFGAGTFGHKFEFAKVLETLDEVQMAARTICGLCSDLPIDGKQTPVSHSLIFSFEIPRSKIFILTHKLGYTSSEIILLINV